MHGVHIYACTMCVLVYKTMNATYAHTYMKTCTYLCGQNRYDCCGEGEHVCVCHMLQDHGIVKKRNGRSGKNSGESQRDTLRNETLNQRFSTFLMAATILSISE